MQAIRLPSKQLKASKIDRRPTGIVLHLQVIYIKRKIRSTQEIRDELCYPNATCLHHNRYEILQ
jgi:hypothetical protein